MLLTLAGRAYTVWESCNYLTLRCVQYPSIILRHRLLPLVCPTILPYYMHGIAVRGVFCPSDANLEPYSSLLPSL